MASTDAIDNRMAQTGLDAMVAVAGRGEDVMPTRDGRPVAGLVA